MSCPLTCGRFPWNSFWKNGIHICMHILLLVVGFGGLHNVQRTPCLFPTPSKQGHLYAWCAYSRTLQNKPIGVQLIYHKTIFTHYIYWNASSIKLCNPQIHMRHAAFNICQPWVLRRPQTKLLLLQWLVIELLKMDPEVRNPRPSRRDLLCHFVYPFYYSRYIFIPFFLVVKIQ